MTTENIFQKLYTGFYLIYTLIRHTKEQQGCIYLDQVLASSEFVRNVLQKFIIEASFW